MINLDESIEQGQDQTQDLDQQLDSLPIALQALVCCFLVPFYNISIGYLYMKGSGKLETTLCPHGFILSIMEGMESQVLYFLVVLIINILQNYYFSMYRYVKCNQ